MLHCCSTLQTPQHLCCTAFPRRHCCTLTACNDVAVLQYPPHCMEGLLSQCHRMYALLLTLGVIPAMGLQALYEQQPKTYICLSCCVFVAVLETSLSCIQLKTCFMMAGRILQDATVATYVDFCAWLAIWTPCTLLCDNTLPPRLCRCNTRGSKKRSATGPRHHRTSKSACKQQAPFNVVVSHTKTQSRGFAGM